MTADVVLYLQRDKNDCDDAADPNCQDARKFFHVPANELYETREQSLGTYLRSAVLEVVEITALWLDEFKI